VPSFEGSRASIIPGGRRKTDPRHKRVCMYLHLGFLRHDISKDFTRAASPLCQLGRSKESRERKLSQRGENFKPRGRRTILLKSHS
jgi:hypothetical protein